MAELTITTQAPGQEGIVGLTGLGTEHGIYCVSVRDSERTDMATLLPRFNRNDVIEFKSVPSRDWRPALGVTGYAMPVFPPKLTPTSCQEFRCTVPKCRTRSRLTYSSRITVETRAAYSNF